MNLPFWAVTTWLPVIAIGLGVVIIVLTHFFPPEE